VNNEPVMTDEEIRSALIDELERRVSGNEGDAAKERRAAKRCAEYAPEDAAEYMRLAAHDDRCAAHFRQVIEFLKTAPMPPAEAP
jgi:hypothetical protein